MSWQKVGPFPKVCLGYIFGQPQPDRWRAWFLRTQVLCSIDDATDTTVTSAFTVGAEQACWLVGMFKVDWA